MTNGQIIERVTFLYSKGVPSDDSRLEPRQIYSKLLTLRSKIIAEDIKKKQRISRWNYQFLDCIELIRTNSHECSCLADTNCGVLRSKYKLPKPLTGFSSHILKDVMTIDGSIIFDETSEKAKKHSKGNKYVKDKPGYIIKNGYLYLTDNKGPKLLTLSGLFEDPEEVKKFKNYCEDRQEDCEDCNQDCESILDKDFPIDIDKVDLLVDLCLNEFINVFPKMIEDKTNNTTDSPQEQSK